MHITRSRPLVKPTVAPVRATVVIFDGGIPTRTTGFGHGLIMSAPSHRAPASFADMAWAATAFGHGPETIWDNDTVDETRAAEVEAMDRLERGCIL